MTKQKKIIVNGKEYDNFTIWSLEDRKEYLKIIRDLMRDLDVSVDDVLSQFGINVTLARRLLQDDNLSSFSMTSLEILHTRVKQAHELKQKHALDAFPEITGSSEPYSDEMY